MFNSFFPRARYKRLAERYRQDVAELQRGDFTSIHRLVRAIRKRTNEEIAEAHLLSPAMVGLLRAKLVLLEELRDRKDGSQKNWSIAFPLPIFWARLSARFNPQSRAGLARLVEQTVPGAGFLSGWVASVGIGITIAVATVAVFTNPTQVAKAGTIAAFITHATSEAASGQATPASPPAPAVGSGRDPANNGDAKGVSAEVTLPNAGGNSGGTKLDQAIKVEPRQIVIHRHWEVRVGEYYSYTHDGTTKIYCIPPVPEELCKTYYVHPTGE